MEFYGAGAARIVDPIVFGEVSGEVFERAGKSAGMVGPGDLRQIEGLDRLPVRMPLGELNLVNFAVTAIAAA